MKIRPANENDAKGILDIYAPYISDTSYTFESEVPSVSEFAARITSYLERWPWLVCEAEGKIAGYAYASRYRERIGYQWSIECSVYVHDDYLGKGVGFALYKPLFEILKEQGYRNVYAVINLPNERSVRFHEKFGFSYLTTYKNVGYKLGKWKNVGWWQLIINEYSHEPAPPLKFSELDAGIVTAILNK